MKAPQSRTMTPFAWAVVVIAVLGFAAAVIWLAVTPAPKTGSVLGDNPTAAVIAVATLLTALGVPIVTNLLAVRRQVQNSHESNLRDDLDDKHEETSTLLRQILATQKEHGGAIVGIRQDLRHLRDVDRDTGRDVAEVRGTVTDLDKKLDAHLEWSRDYVQNQEKNT
jgi:hypothetical protein